MTPIGHQKDIDTWTERLGEGIEAVAVVGPGDHLGAQFVKTTASGKPSQLLILVVGSGMLRLCRQERLGRSYTEVFARPCADLDRIERRKGFLGDRVRLGFPDGERVSFKALRPRGREVVALIADNASVPIEPFGKA